MKKGGRKEEESVKRRLIARYGCQQPLMHCCTTFGKKKRIRDQSFFLTARSDPLMQAVFEEKKSEWRKKLKEQKEKGRRVRRLWILYGLWLWKTPLDIAVNAKQRTRNKDSIYSNRKPIWQLWKEEDWCGKASCKYYKEFMRKTSLQKIHMSNKHYREFGKK